MLFIIDRVICLPVVPPTGIFYALKNIFSFVFAISENAFYLCGVNSLKSRKMTHSISHEYDEILFPAMPGVEIHVVYKCESEIAFDEYGDEESNRLISIAPFVNSRPVHCSEFPEMRHGEQAKRFLARLRESARQALHAQLLREGLNELGKPVQSFIE